MEQIKLFSGYTPALDRLELAINLWFKENSSNIEVVRTEQSQSSVPGGNHLVVVSIYYKKKKTMPDNNVKAPSFKPFRDTGGPSPDIKTPSNTKVL